LDTKIRDYNIDLDKKWITTWNDYPWRIKYLLRWLHNHKEKEEKGMEPLQQSDWTTPPFANIKKKKTKRLSPYLESELWERDEILVMRYLTFLDYIALESGQKSIEEKLEEREKEILMLKQRDNVVTTSIQDLSDQLFKLTKEVQEMKKGQLWLR
jgi:hypothetical protein